jgi:hypothetical protein
MGLSSTIEQVSPAAAAARRRRDMRQDIAAVAVLLVIATVCWLPRLNGPIDLRWDGAVYYTLGTALAEGKGYRLLNEPGDIQATQYPPVWPAVIAGFQRLSGTDDPTFVGHRLRLFAFALFAVYGVAIYALARRAAGLPPAYAFGASAIAITNFWVCFLSDLAFPETMFSLVTVLFVLCDRSGRRMGGTLAGICAVLAYGLRTVGIAVLLAWVIDAALRRRMLAAGARILVTVAVATAWQGYIRSVEGAPEYTHPAYAYQRADYLFYNVSYARNAFLEEPFRAGSPRVSWRTLVERVARNALYVPLQFGAAVGEKTDLLEEHRTAANRAFRAEVIPRAATVAALTVIALLVIAGLAIMVLEGERLMPLYIALSVASMTLTPWPEQFSRYFAPLVPFLSIFLLLTVWKLAQLGRARLRGPGRRLIGVTLVALVAGILAEHGLTLSTALRTLHQEATYTDRRGIRVSYRMFFYDEGYRALDAGIDWLQQHADDTGVAASSMPQWVYLRTGRKTVMPPFEGDPARAQHLLDTVPVAFIVFDRALATNISPFLAPVMERFPNRWTPVYSDTIPDPDHPSDRQTFAVYKRVDGSD